MLNSTVIDRKARPCLRHHVLAITFLFSVISFPSVLLSFLSFLFMIFLCCYLEILTFRLFSSRLLHLHVTLAILFSSPSPPPLSLYLPLFPSLFPSSHFPNVALSNHKPLPLKSSDPLVFLLHSIHRKEEELLTMQQSTVLVRPTVPCILIYIKAGHFKGYKETKERITGERSKAEVDCEDKGYVMVVKTPRCPGFEILHPTTCSKSNKFWIYLLVASQSLWESVSRI